MSCKHIQVRSAFVGGPQGQCATCYAIELIERLYGGKEDENK